MTSPPEFGRVEVPVDDVSIEAAYFRREGADPPVVYLHGLGSSLRDFLNAADPDGLPGLTLFSVDFPGCGRTPYRNSAQLTMEYLARFVLTLLDRLFSKPVVLVGHSMGGLAALLTAVQAPHRVRALVNIEGNLTPEDCFLSRKGANWKSPGFGERLQVELRSSGKAGFLCYAERFRNEVSDDAFQAYSRSIVRHSEVNPLLEWFTGMTIPRLFIYGDENRHLDYLARLADAGVELSAIAESNHFPLYSNPAAFFASLRSFLNRIRSFTL